jgi:EAL domain-containing protein (putative c-di-GMP-specific phosphodiesterase class I)
MTPDEPGEIAQEAALARIRRAVSGEGLSMEFQPIFDLRDGGVTGVEALARFALEPRRGPDAWFREAAEAGLGVDLELAAVRVALAGLDAVTEGLFMGLNVSPWVMASGGLSPLLAGLEPRIVLEVGEGWFGAADGGVRQASQVLREAGARFSVDDAGHDDAALSGALELHPDFVKLDIPVCRNVHLDPVGSRRVAELVAAATASGARPVAEGVQAQGEVQTLRGLGVAFGQGYFLALPGRLPLGDLSAVSARLAAGDPA